MTQLKEQVRNLFDSMAQSMAKKDVDHFASHFAVPFVTYLLDEILVAPTQQDLHDLLSLRLRTAVTDDVDQITAKIIDAEDNGGGRATVIIQWSFLGFDEEVLRSNLIRYMVSQRRTGPGMIVEMGEYLWVSDMDMAQSVIAKLRTKTPAWLN